MKPSRFSSFGFFAFSAEPSLHEQYYNAMVAGLTDPSGRTKPYDLSRGTHLEATIYARAKQMALADATMRRAGNQIYPYKCIELLPLLEKDYDIVPGPTDTILQRQAAIAVKQILARGAVRENIIDALKQTIGDEFLGYAPAKEQESPLSVAWSHNIVYGTMAPAASGPSKWAVLSDPVVSAASHTVRFTTTLGDAILTGDVVVVDGDNTGRTEVVTVTSATSTTITATFTKPHDNGATLTTMSYPGQASTIRTNLIVVRDATDAAVRKKVDELMARLLRAPDTWAVVQPSTYNLYSGTIAPFAPTTPLGTRPLGTLVFDIG